MNIADALGLIMLLLTKIQEAHAANLTAIEIDDLGEQFKAVNDRIQAARDTF